MNLKNTSTLTTLTLTSTVRVKKLFKLDGGEYPALVIPPRFMIKKLG